MNASTLVHSSEDNDSDDAHLLRCWAIQNCRGCLAQTDCSWCPFSWTCMPNNHRVALLAPAWDEHVCPHWAERWELRTRPLGCQVSTITALTALVAVACTLALGLLVAGLVLGIRWLRDYGRKHPGWWRRGAWWGWGYGGWGGRARRLFGFGFRGRGDGGGGTGGENRDWNREREPLLPSSDRAAGP
ncbi:hypothetical protein F4779DRAFT_168868 [Xylariaceae sp. FL0662B]|nr:hypothetical protein F4779DRAFT_168868 [Xylariaceae sp. FL0662B]